MAPSLAPHRGSQSQVRDANTGFHLGTGVLAGVLQLASTVTERYDPAACLPSVHVYAICHVVESTTVRITAYAQTWQLTHTSINTDRPYSRVCGRLSHRMYICTTHE